MSLRLIIENLDGVTTMVPLEDPEVSIGRTSENSVQLSEQNVSRAHAKMSMSADGWRIEDRASYNGVSVNGVAIDRSTVVREGDLIQIGDYHLVLADSGARKTVDLQHLPRIRPVEEPLLATSSADLPALSEDELAALREGHPELEDRRFPRVGVTLAVVCVAVIVAGIYQFSRGGPVPSTPSVDVRPADTAERSASAPAGAPAVGTPTPAKADTAPQTSDEYPESELESPPRPADAKRTRKSRSKSSKRPRSATPVQDAKIALRRARSALEAGRPGQAYSMASQAYDLHRTNAAMLVKGKAACQLRHRARAKRALRKLGGSSKKKLVEFCSELDVEL